MQVFLSLHLSFLTSLLMTKVLSTTYMLIIYIIVIYRKLLKLIFLNLPLINNKKGSNVNIALKVDEREFPFLNIKDHK